MRLCLDKPLTDLSPETGQCALAEMDGGFWACIPNTLTASMEKKVATIPMPTISIEKLLVTA